nr:hypothetical protein [Frankia nepalensis]
MEEAAVGGDETAARRGWREQTESLGAQDGREPVGHPELAVQPFQVLADGPFGDRQPTRGRAGGQPFGECCQDDGFAWRDRQFLGGSRAG